MKTTLRTLLLIALSIFGAGANAQEMEEARPLNHFNQVIASPRVNVILQKGDEESIRLIYNQIPKSKVNVIVKGGKLKIYLDHARVTEKQVRNIENNYSGRRGLYAGSSITAYVTYKDLKSIEIRGDGEIRCDSALSAEKFKLKAYGANEIRLASLTSRKFKASLYGANELRIISGSTNRQIYRVFGENRVDTRGFKSENATTRIYGDGRIRLYASDEVHIRSFGEPKINIDGTSIVTKGIVLGHAAISVNH